MSSQKQKKHSVLKRAISVALMASVCLTAAVTVATFTQTVTVSEEKTDVTEKNEEPIEVEVKAENTESSVIESSLMDFNVDSSANETSFIMAAKEDAAFADADEDSDIDIRIEEWRSIVIDLRGKTIKKDVPAGTVADAFAYLDIELTKNDELDVDKDAELEDGMEIVVTKVTYKKVTNKEDIDFDVINKDTSDLYVGETSVETDGVKGERTIVIKERYENGRKVSEEEISNEVTKEPVDKVILNGTAVEEVEEVVEEESYIDTDSANVTVDDSLNTITDKYGNTLYYTDVITGSSTAYTADPGAICSTGRLARYGVVAVNPNIIPYGSILYIVSDDGIVYGYAVAGDTGGFIYNGTGTIVDLYYPSLQDCINYGRRGVHVYVLSGVSEDATYNN